MSSYEMPGIVGNGEIGGWKSILETFNLSLSSTFLGVYGYNRSRPFLGETTSSQISFPVLRNDLSRSMGKRKIIQP